MNARRINAKSARARVAAGALLVCAYDDEKCSQHHLRGSIALSELEQRLSQLHKDQEMIFYCA